jgi:hypothetical protein
MFLLRCDHCDFRRFLPGESSEETKDLVPVEGCKNCGGPKKYKCPLCGYVVKARRQRPTPPTGGQS